MEKIDLSFTRKKDGKQIKYHREPKRPKETIPTKPKYLEIVNKLSTERQFDVLMALRLGCEMGMARIDIVNAEVKYIDLHKPRSLWIEKSKLVRRGYKKVGKKKEPVFKMRSREMPINSSLYQFLMSYIDKNSKYIIKRYRGNPMEPFKALHITYLYDKADIPWSTHQSRHYFKNQIMNWMREQMKVDYGLIKELMGHSKTTTEDYGSISWEYKQKVIDGVFK